MRTTKQGTAPPRLRVETLEGRCLLSGHGAWMGPFLPIENAPATEMRAEREVAPRSPVDSVSGNRDVSAPYASFIVSDAIVVRTADGAATWHVENVLRLPFFFANPIRRSDGEAAPGSGSMPLYAQSDGASAPGQFVAPLSVGVRGGKPGGHDSHPTLVRGNERWITFGNGDVSLPLRLAPIDGGGFQAAFAMNMPMLKDATSAAVHALATQFDSDAITSVKDTAELATMLTASVVDARYSAARAGATTPSTAVNRSAPVPATAATPSLARSDYGDLDAGLVDLQSSANDRRTAHDEAMNGDSYSGITEAELDWLASEQLKTLTAQPERAAVTSEVPPANTLLVGSLEGGMIALDSGPIATNGQLLARPRGQEVASLEMNASMGLFQAIEFAEASEELAAASVLGWPAGVVASDAPAGDAPISQAPSTESTTPTYQRALLGAAVGIAAYRMLRNYRHDAKEEQLDLSRQGS